MSSTLLIVTDMWSTHSIVTWFISQPNFVRIFIFPPFFPSFMSTWGGRKTSINWLATQLKRVKQENHNGCHVAGRWRDSFRISFLRIQSNKPLESAFRRNLTQALLDTFFCDFLSGHVLRKPPFFDKNFYGGSDTYVVWPLRMYVL